MGGLTAEVTGVFDTHTWVKTAGLEPWVDRGCQCDGGPGHDQGRTRQWSHPAEREGLHTMQGMRPAEREELHTRQGMRPAEREGLRTRQGSQPAERERLCISMRRPPH
eukprot:366238-Chlamydomonas_euryale.AAC.3